MLLDFLLLRGKFEQNKNKIRTASLVWLGNFKQGVYQPEFPLLKK
jgi:hypothetical protein